MSTDKNDISLEDAKTDIRKSIDDASVRAVEDIVLDPKKEAKLLVKLDAAFVPIIMLTYLTCFLDRTNIGKFLMINSLRLRLTVSRKCQGGRHARGHRRLRDAILDRRIDLLRDLRFARVPLGGADEEAHPAKHPHRPLHRLVGGHHLHRVHRERGGPVCRAIDFRGLRGRPLPLSQPVPDHGVSA